jgi:glucosamine 6-phosphate synthetase-like amidotransferase/phosphosugar isomerase protein
MCGIWGFSGKPDPGILRQIIERAGERGGDSCGFHGYTKMEELTYRAIGNQADHLWTIAKDCIVGIGHARLATHGSITIRNAQPIVNEEIALVHNGVIEKHESVMEDLGYVPKTDLDSEAAIPLLLNRMPIPGATAWIGSEADKPTLHWLSNGLPIVVKKIRGTTYICSKEWE